MPWPGIEPAICRSRVQDPTTTPPSHCRLARLQRLLRSWSVQHAWGWPGRRLQSLTREPDASLTWQCRALCAGVPWVSRAMWPNTDKWFLLMKSITGGKPERADISALNTGVTVKIRGWPELLLLAKVTPNYGSVFLWRFFMHFVTVIAGWRRARSWARRAMKTGILTLHIQGLYQTWISWHSCVPMLLQANCMMFEVNSSVYTVQTYSRSIVWM